MKLSFDLNRSGLEPYMSTILYESTHANHYTIDARSYLNKPIARPAYNVYTLYKKKVELYTKNIGVTFTLYMRCDITLH